jgi:hypothetical protein
MRYDHEKVLLSYYSCDRCNKRKKANKKYVKPCKCKNKRKGTIEIKCTCEGDAECKICSGKGRFTILGCIRQYLIEPDARILQYFDDYLYNKEFPSKSGRYNTPEMLLESFNVLLTVYNQEELKNYEKKNPKR